MLIHMFIHAASSRSLAFWQDTMNDRILRTSQMRSSSEAKVPHWRTNIEPLNLCISEIRKLLMRFSRNTGMDSTIGTSIPSAVGPVKKPHARTRKRSSFVFVVPVDQRKGRSWGQPLPRAYAPQILQIAVFFVRVDGLVASDRHDDQRH